MELPYQHSLKGASDTMDSIALLSSFNSVNSAISEQNGVISGLYTDPPDTPLEDRTGYDAVYDRYVDAYNDLSEADKAKIRKARGRGRPVPENESAFWLDVRAGQMCKTERSQSDMLWVLQECGQR